MSGEFDVDAFAAQLIDGYGTVSVEPLAGPLVRVVLPNPRNVHDAVVVLIDVLDDGFLLSDAGDLRSTFGSDADEVVEILRCSGAAIEMEDQFATVYVASPGELVHRVLSFGHYLSAAPIAWHAHKCRSTKVMSSRPDPSVRVMAKETKATMVSHIGKQAEPVIRLDARVYGNGERARAPLAVQLGGTHRPVPPRLVCSFIDLSASPVAQQSAKSLTALLGLVLLESTTVPRYLVARGSQNDIDRMSELFEPENWTTVATTNLDLLLEDTDRAVRELLPA